MARASRLLWAVALGTGSAVGIACGGGMVDGSVATLSSARAAIRAADEVGAEEVPQAALHLKHARDQVAVAEELLDDGDEDAAQRMFQRAESDAEVALSLARRSVAEDDAEEAHRRLSELRRTAGQGGSNAGH